MDMHRAFGLAGRARSVEPEAHVIADRRRGVGFHWRIRQQILKQRISVPVVSGDDHLHEIRARFDQLGESWKQRLRHHQRLRAAVGEHEAVIILGHQRIDRNRHNPALDRSEERGGPVDRIEEREQDALLAMNSRGTQHMAEAVDALGQLPIAPHPARIDIDRLVRASGAQIALDDVRGKVVTARYRVDRSPRIELRRSGCERTWLGGHHHG